MYPSGAMSTDSLPAPVAAAVIPGRPSAPPPSSTAGEEAAGVLRSARTFSLGTLASRALGIVRDGTIAHLLGAGAAADAFAIAFRVPNLLRELVGEGALTSAFLPGYARRKAEGDAEGARRLFRTVFTLLATGLALLTLAAVAFFLTVPVEVFRPEDPAKTALVLDLCAWCFPYAVFVCGSALFAAVLQAEGRFAIPALAPAAMNAAWILGTLALVPLFDASPEGRARAVAASVLFAGLVQAAIAFPLLRRLDLLPRPTWAIRDPALRTMLRRMGPAVLGLAPVQVNLLVNALLAAALIPGDGANSSLWYAGRLLQLPLALVGISVGVAAFPAFARLASENRRSDLGSTAAGSLRAVLLFALPATAGLAVLALPAVTLLYRHGRFTPEDAAAAAGVLRYALVGLPAFCALQVMTRLFHSLGDTATPVRVGAWNVALCFAGNLLLVGPLGARGLALSTALCAWVNLAALVWIARRNLRIRGLRTLGPAAARSAAWGLLAAAGAMAGVALAEAWIPPGPKTAALAATLAGVLAGGAACVAAALAFRDPDALDFRASLLRRRGG
jgi:putative peptidoglycan lipid II flippase